DDRMGAAASDALLLRVTLEAILAHPFSIALTYGRNFVVAFFLADSPYTWKHRTFGPEWTGPYLAKEAQASGDSSVATPLDRALVVILPPSCSVVVGETFIGARFPGGSRWGLGFFFCLPLVQYNQPSVVWAPPPETRYPFYIVPPLLVAVTMGLQAY